MNGSKIVFIYTLLSLLLIASAVVLAYEVKHYLYERKVIEFEDPQVTVAEEIRKAEEAENQARAEIINTFNQTIAFQSLVTPVPRPSPTPLPPSTPTPIVPANGYKLLNVMGTYATLQRYDGTKILSKVGDKVQETFGDFEVLEIISRPPSVKIKDVRSGTVRIINEEQRKAPAQAPKK